MKRAKYNKALQQLLQASPEEALAHNREIRDARGLLPSHILEQKLISFRLALKNGNGRFLDPDELKTETTYGPQLVAEAHFVRGMIFLHKDLLEKAAAEFEQAGDKYFLSENLEKSLLSRFNSLIAKSNGGLLTAQQELNLCNQIFASAQENNIPKIQALCLRQKSYCYYTSGRAKAAYNEILQALPLIELHCPISDYHLAQVHAADCAFESGDPNLAKVHMDYLPEQHDARVDFPKAYLFAKLNGHLLDLDQFTDVNVHWKSRYQSYLEKRSAAVLKKTRVYWNPKTFWITSEKKQIVGRIRSNSLEGLLLKMLMRGPQSKELLCEALWPEYSTNENLDDRFFRLKNRLNQKLGALVVFDGQYYSLAVEIKWT